MQKGFATIFIILGIILAVGIVAGAYYLGTKKSQPSSQYNSEPVQPSPKAVLQNPPTSTPASTNNQAQTSPSDSNIPSVEYLSPSHNISFKYYPEWKLLSAPPPYDGGNVIELQGPHQRLRIYDGGTPNYGFDDFKIENTTAVINGKTFPARKFTSQSFGNSFIDVKVQETPYKLYVQYGDAASVGFQGFNQQYAEKVNFEVDIEPIQKILQTFTYK